MYAKGNEARSKSESHRNKQNGSVGRFMDEGDSDRERMSEDGAPANRTYNKSIFSRFKAVDFIDQ